MNMSFTWDSLLLYCYNQGLNCSECAIGSMMDMVADENDGVFPEWSSCVPDWVIRTIFNEGLSSSVKIFDEV